MLAVRSNRRTQQQQGYSKPVDSDKMSVTKLHSDNRIIATPNQIQDAGVMGVVVMAVVVVGALAETKPLRLG